MHFSFLLNVLIIAAVPVASLLIGSSDHNLVKYNYQVHACQNFPCDNKIEVQKCTCSCAICIKVPNAEVKCADCKCECPGGNGFDKCSDCYTCKNCNKNISELGKSISAICTCEKCDCDRDSDHSCSQPTCNFWQWPWAHALVIIVFAMQNLSVVILNATLSAWIRKELIHAKKIEAVNVFRSG
ncbi:13809_t:CDS:2 [Dentiscutata erythropus]|uniref:13809_t:CDS:1 n=1 Tax=Dentiscutata erythropus TaxID=1348616 RepID=A0A9N8VFX7_9GLOM|nr:13809_t:CDS:2 [Dentiscutata erythropus]